MYSGRNIICYLALFESGLVLRSQESRLKVDKCRPDSLFLSYSWSGTVAVNSRTDCHVQEERKVCGNLSNGNWRLQRDNVSPRRVHYN